MRIKGIKTMHFQKKKTKTRSSPTQMEDFEIEKAFNVIFHYIPR